MDTLLQDFRYALRSLLKSPGFTAVAVLALALGIGGNTAVFSIIHTLLYRPLPFPDADRLVVVWDNNVREGQEFSEVAPGHVRALRERGRSFQGVAAYDYAGFTLTGAGEPEQVEGHVVDAGFFPMLGVRPALGRGFLPGEDRPAAAPVVVLGHELWRRRFAEDPRVVGRTILLDGVATTVVGVLPADFRFPGAGDVWTPLALSDSAWQLRGEHFLRVIGKLRPGVSVDDARAEADALSRELERSHPETNRGWRMSVQPLNEGLFQGPIVPIMVVLLGAVGFVLLIACADVANLLLARAATREREVAVRLAMGAGRARLVRQLLTESLLLALLGGAAGVVLAVWGLDALGAMIPATLLRYVPQMAHLGIDGAVLGYTLLLSFGTGILFGLVPALQASRPDLASTLKEGDRGSAGVRRGRLRSTLVVSEVALALVLVTATGLMVKSFLRQLSANPGFRPERSLVFWLNLPEARYREGERIVAFQDALVERLRSLPGVESVGTVDPLPLTGEGRERRFTVEGRPVLTPADTPWANLRVASPGYFQAIGIPLLRGRGFTDADREGAPGVALVSQAMAEQFWPGEDPVGKRVVVQGGRPREVVGVVGDVADWRAGNRSPAFLYIPYTQAASPRIGVVVRTRNDALTAAAAVRRAVFTLDPEQPVHALRSMDEVLSEALIAQRINAVMLSVLAGIALLLAVVGVYGVVAYSVARRTHEIGVRVALGASTGDVLRLVVGQGMRPVLLGVALGVLGALAVSRLLSAILWGVSATDPATLAGVPALLAGVAVLACWLPARRAARVDPMVALRSE
ncbi:MAG TPA: ABC transporter permease [Longimicrobiaceae bacterium]|nr:ABC transporter permease [Longimicrobiaceae bacterium]